MICIWDGGGMLGPRFVIDRGIQLEVEAAQKSL